MSIETFADLGGWFHEQLDAALTRRGVQAGDGTRAYLADLLARMGLEHDPDSLRTPLAIQLAEARAIPTGAERLRRFRALGDDALYLRGFCTEHLEHRGISAAYVATLGEAAYDHAGELARRSAARSVGEVYGELARKFALLAAALDEIRESTALRTPGDVIRLYDRWQKTHSPRLAERLTEEGVFPSLGPKNLVVH
jgi:hypothetical protein